MNAPLQGVVHGGEDLIDGDLTVMATVTGARNAVATLAGTAYLTDWAAGRILVVVPAVSP